MEHLEKLKSDIKADQKELAAKYENLIKAKANVEGELEKVRTELIRLNGAELILEELGKREAQSAEELKEPVKEEKKTSK